jgi:hypothetical protein
MYEFVGPSTVCPSHFSQDASSFYNDLHHHKVDAQPRLNLTYSLFHGASFKLRDPAKVGVDLARIKKLPTVKQVWPVHTFTRPKEEVIWTGGSNEAVPPKFRARQESENGAISSHLMTQVDLLHAKGITGKGIRIGVVDDGVSQRHPVFVSWLNFSR